MLGSGFSAYFEISPSHKSRSKSTKENDAEPPPILRLLPFTHSPKISFGNVKPGVTKKVVLHILNPKDLTQEVYCEKCPTEEDGFNFSFLRAVVEPGDTVELFVSWTPAEVGSMRNVIHWRTSIGVRSQTILMGNCIEPKPKANKGRGSKTRGPRVLCSQMRPPLAVASGRRSPQSENIAPNPSKRGGPVNKNNKSANNKPKVILGEACTNTLQVKGSNTVRPKKNHKVGFSNDVQINNYINESLDESCDEITKQNYAESENDQNEMCETRPVFRNDDGRENIYLSYSNDARDETFLPSSSDPQPNFDRRETYLKSSSDLNEFQTLSKAQRNVKVTHFPSDDTKSSQYSDRGTIDYTFTQHQLDIRCSSKVEINRVHPGEEFGDARTRLLSCDVAASPIRRQTYVKSTNVDTPLNKEFVCIDESTEIENSQLTPGKSQNIQILSQDTPSYVKSDSRFLPNDSFVTHNIDITPNLPARRATESRRMTSTTAQMESYKEMLAEWDKLLESPVVAKQDQESVVAKQDQESCLSEDEEIIETFASLSACRISDAIKSTDIQGDNYQKTLTERWLEDVMYSAHSSPVQSYVTAPSTPTENELTLENLVENCEKTQEFPTPKIAPLDSDRVGNLSTPTMESLIFLKDTTISTDSLDRSTKMNECYDQIDFSKNLDHSSLDDIDLQRLSNGTVILENSLLHAKNVVDIDITGLSSIYPKSTTGGPSPLIKCNTPLSYEVFQFDHEECGTNDNNNSNQSNLSEIKLDVKNTPVSQPDNKNRALHTPTMDHKKQMNLFSGSVTDSMCRSIADLSLFPKHPKHCSTIIKESNMGPPHSSPLVSKKELFKSEDGTPNLKSGCAKNTDNLPLDNLESFAGKNNLDKDVGIEYITNVGTQVEFNVQTNNKDDQELSKSKLCARNILRSLDNQTEQSLPSNSTDGKLAFVKPDPPEEVNEKSFNNLNKPKGTTFKISPPKSSATKSTTKAPVLSSAFKKTALKSSTKKPKVLLNSTLIKNSVKKHNQQPTKIKTLVKEQINSKNASAINKTYNLNITAKSTNSISSSNLSCSSSSSKYRTKAASNLSVRSKLGTSVSSQFSASSYKLNPYATLNMYYDDRWAEKQISGFQKWLNFVLTPPEEESQTHDSKTVDIAKVWMEANRCSSTQHAPSKEAVSLKIYSAKRRMAKLRRAACKLYQSPEVALVVRNVEAAISKKLLVIRKDRETHANIGLKQQMLKLLLSYNPLWLRIGLETVYGEILNLACNDDVTGIARFIAARFLSCPDIAKNFAHPTVPFSYRAGYEEALKVFQLKKILVLVYFLDVAKESRLIDHDPCLFKKDSEFKTTRDVLVSFARDFLSGVGDITKHLAYMGYMVSHKQSILDEFDFAVKTLQTDLRCGVRLAKITEILTHNYSICEKLRLPALSLLQKIHNVDLSLHALRDEGVVGSSPDEKYSAKDIVNGHQEKTLNLLWDMIFGLQIKNILSVSQLLREIHYLRRTLSVKSYTDEIAKVAYVKLQNSKELSLFNEENDASSELIIRLLKLWAQLVCAHYGVQVENLSVSFCDGRAFCVVLHHYHPELLSLADVQFKTSFNVTSAAVDFDVSLDSSLDNAPHTNAEDMQQLAGNDKLNFNLFISKLNTLGGVPILIKSSDMINTIPDQKVTTTFLAYLCARLLNLSAEIQAARVIQLAWRKRLAGIRRRRLEIETEAAKKIQACWRNHCLRKRKVEYTKAAIVIQSHWRRARAQRHLASLKEVKIKETRIAAAVVIQRCYRKYTSEQNRKKHAAAVLIQKYWRKYREMRQFLVKNKAAVRIQSAIRCYVARKRFCDLRKSCLHVQRRWRKMLQQRKEAQMREFVNDQARIIQRAWKTFSIRQSFLVKKEKTIVIQSYVRGCIARKSYQKTRNAVIGLQQRYRANKQMTKCRHEYLLLKRSVITIKNSWFSYNIRCGFLEMRKCAVIIQSAYRMKIERRKYKCLKSSAVEIQKRWRETLEMRRCRSEYLSMKASAVVIQKRWRETLEMRRCRSEYLSMEASAVVIQKRWRETLETRRCRSEYLPMKASAVVIQKRWRETLETRRCRSEYLSMKASAVVIQKRWMETLDTRRCRGEYLFMKASAVVIQKRWRETLETRRCRTQYLLMKASAIIIQSIVRRWIARRKYLEVYRHVVLMQASVRSFVARSKFLRLKAAAIKIQRWYQRVKERRGLLKNEKATIIQATYRGYRQRKQFLEIKRSAILTQSCYRRNRVLKDLKNKHKSATIIQSAYRGYRSRWEYKKLKKATITIQSHFRKYSVIRDLKEKHEKATIIQSCFRGYLQLCRFSQQKEAALIIQSIYRAYSIRKNLKTQTQSALTIQSWYRKCSQRNKYLQMKCAAITIQRFYRNYKMVSKSIEEYHIMIKTITLLQACARGCLVRQSLKKQNSAAIIVQSRFRRHIAQKNYKKTITTATVIQSYWRAALLTRRARTSFLMIKGATICIQSIWRGRCVRAKLNHETRAATLIQSFYRAYVIRRSYHVTKHSVIIIQKWWRDILLMRYFKEEYEQKENAALVIQRFFGSLVKAKLFERRNNAALVLQKHWRTRKASQEFERTKRAVMIIQNWWRSLMQMNMQRYHYLYLQGCIILIQARMRGLLARKNYRKALRETLIENQQREAAATRIQTWWRSVTARKQFLGKKMAVTTLQCYWRASLQMIVDREYFIYLRRASIIIQRAWRRRMMKKTNAASLIQRNVRKWISRKNTPVISSPPPPSVQFNEIDVTYSIPSEALITHEHPNGKTFLSLEDEKESIVNDNSSNQNHIEIHNSSETEQLYVNSQSISIRTSDVVLDLSTKAHGNVLEPIDRANRDSSILQAPLESESTESNGNDGPDSRLDTTRTIAIASSDDHRDQALQMVREQAAVEIQRRWRGFALRKSLMKMRRITQIRGRLLIATNEACPAATIGVRSDAAIRILVHEKDLKWKLTALLTLDTCTRLSGSVCENLLSCSGLEALMLVFRVQNRSLPSMEIIFYCLNILITLAKFPPARDPIVKIHDLIDILTQKMKICYEKNVPVFLKSATLLYILAISPVRVKDLYTSRTKTDLTSLETVMTRKAKLASSNRVIAKPKLCTKKPTLTPDWSMGSTEIREFAEPLIALRTLKQIIESQSSA